jgi:hypothetical protein
MRRTITVMGLGVLALAATPTGARRQEEAVSTRHYSLHSDPWINLHHFLYQWTRADLGIGTGRAAVLVPEREGPQATGAAARVWSDALAFYAANVAERGHFDSDMLTLKTGLVELGGDPGATPPDDIPGISEHLAAAMPVYRELWWPNHNRANRRWVTHVVDDVRAYEDRWVETVSRTFGGEWPEGRLRVDASAYANWQGGYTSNGPPHAVIWSTDPTNLEGLYGLEMVFHESGHVSSLGAPLRATVREIFREAGVEEPANLRHAMLFGTAGELTRMIAAERGLPEHVRYINLGLSDFAGWRVAWRVVEARWLPVVRGETDRIEALRLMAADLGG